MPMQPAGWFEQLKRIAACPWTAVLLSAVAGCTYADRPLNGGALLLEQRASNRTRAATFATITPPPATGRSIEMKPDLGPVVRPVPAAVVDRNGDGYFVGLALSGGGSRSANFSAACMFQLERVGLLQKVDYISSVSGGSLAGAYYCLFGDGTGPGNGWNPAEVQQKLTYAFATDMLIQTLLPWNGFALVFSDYDRSDLLAYALNRHLYNRDGRPLTYADLRADRPRLLINATNLQSGRGFVFCNETFDSLNADLANYPIAYAVAASSSVPVVLHEVTLRDFSTTYEQYVHLVDGGTTDNLGIETLVQTYRAQVEAALAAGLPDPYPNGAVFVVLDARVDFDARIGAEGDPGFFQSLRAAAGLTTSALLNRASTASLDDVIFRNAPDDSTAKQLREGIATLGRDGYVEFKNVGGHRIRVAHLALSQASDVREVPYRGFGEALNGISTYFNIGPIEANDLYVAADLLMKDRFERPLMKLVTEMNRTPAAGTTSPATIPAPVRVPG